MAQDAIQQQDKESYLYGTNIAFIAELYQRYQQDRKSVDASWASFFEEMKDSVESVIRDYQGPSWARRNFKVVGYTSPEEMEAQKKAAEKKGGDPKALQQACSDSIYALMLVRAYKVRGALAANLDPLGISAEVYNSDLDPATYGFSESDYDRPMFIGGVFGYETITLRELIPLLRQTYSNTIGVEFMHIPVLEQRDWIAERFEAVHGRPHLTAEGKKSALRDMIQLEMFEQFLHVKFPGAKRFSAEGAEAGIAALEVVIKTAAELGVKEIVLGMPHRGRLNVLTKVMGRPYAALLTEFMGGVGAFPEDMGMSGDVKYHQGASSDRTFGENKVHLSLTANPSHLEAVNPVVSGKVRAKQDQMGDRESRLSAMGLLLHGDASFAGQGVVAETLALSDLKGYTTGGTIHVILNNQIGFTTNPRDSRSSLFPSDVAKIVHAPIFHANGDDPESVMFAAQLAVEFRQRFRKDVVIDVVCYRRYGHNEGDEPRYTQPLMYNAIGDHPTPMHAYAERLIAEGAVTQAEFEEMKKEFREFLEKQFEKAENYKAEEADWLAGKWKGIKNPGHTLQDEVKTGVAEKTLKQIGKALVSWPQEMAINSKLERQLQAKDEMFKTGEGIDWATAEALAFGSLLLEGNGVRLSGQDCTRGTFSQRHSGFIDQKTEQRYFPLNNLGGKQAEFEVIDSNLSEFAVMGFEYGYASAEPNCLVLWEGQFGDFANGAQVIIDQFVASGEVKWLRLNGLVLLLPHGYEGQGPEHSSARLERYLQLCAEDNLQVANCSTPANYFHILRRQMCRDFRKPLVLMTPKSLLRHKLCVSNLKDMAANTRFQRVIGEQDKLVADTKVRRVVICSGKVYYDLYEERAKRKIDDVAIVRLEQFYPYPDADLGQELKRYKNADIIWCQEEPENNGAWHFLDRRIEGTLTDIGHATKRPRYVGRTPSAAPSEGYMKIFQKRQSALIDEALGKK